MSHWTLFQCERRPLFEDAPLATDTPNLALAATKYYCRANQNRLVKIRVGSRIKSSSTDQPQATRLIRSQLNFHRHPFACKNGQTQYFLHLISVLPSVKT